MASKSYNRNFKECAANNIEQINKRIDTAVPFVAKFSAKQKLLFLFIVFLLLVIIVIIIIIIIATREDSFSRSCAIAHNNYRQTHGSPPLVIDSDLVDFAKDRAEYLADTDIFRHASDLRGYGENLHFISPYRHWPCADVVKAWYDEISDYDYRNPSARSPRRRATGHFTQVVWKRTLYIGCAQQYSSTNNLYTVCVYDPRGNNLMEMRDNVLPPLYVRK